MQNIDETEKMESNEALADQEISCTESDEDRIKREKEELRARSLRLRKRLIPILSISLAVLILVPLILVLVLENLQKDPSYEPVDYPEYNFDPVYDGNILEYDLYLGYNREVVYYDNLQGYGTPQILTEETAEPHFKLLYDYIQSIITGDERLYNSFFNETYFKSHDNQDPFEQQMLYDITIYHYSTENLEDGDTLNTYQVDYMILKNNGTFRRDIGSNMIRSQYLVVREEHDGTVSIEDLVTKRMAVKVD